MKLSWKLINLILFFMFIFEAPLYADSLPSSRIATPSMPVINKPFITPSPPTVNAKSYILIDVDSGKNIAEKNSDEKLPPASLTKMMTLYVISNALRSEQIHLNDNVHISKEAWKISGSRMFIKEGQEVSIEDLLKGIIVDSGNDACVAMAEHLGGSEAGFAEIMNQQAASLGMQNSHFTDSTGMPDEQHYTSAKDLAILGRSLVTDFPQYYHWYKQKWFTYNGIRQPNRNRLLWRNGQVDGIKTGHTNEAGFCLVASAKRENMRLLSVVMGAPNESTRADDSERLLNYGFRFYETHKLYKSKQSIIEIPVYKGSTKKLAAGLLTNQYITIPSGQYQHLNISTEVSNQLIAPVSNEQKVGNLIIKLDDKVLETYPLYALNEIKSGGFFTRSKDSIRLMFKRWLG